MPTALVKPTQALRHMVARVVKKYRDDLEGVTIEPVFTDKTSAGAQFGKLHILSGIKVLPYYLGKGQEDAADLANSQSMLMVEVPKDTWDILKDDSQREALIDHLLCFCERDIATGKIEKVSPDIEEFNVVAQRHGKWHVSLKDFFSACQGKLKFEEPAAPAEEEPKPRRARRGDEPPAPGTTV